MVRWGGVGWWGGDGYHRPDQFLDHLTVIKRQTGNQSRRYRRDTKSALESYFPQKNMLFEFSLQYLEQIWMTQVTATYQVGLISIRIWCYRNWISVRFRVCQELNRLLGRLKTIRYLRMRLEQKYFFQTEGETQLLALCLQQQLGVQQTAASKCTICTLSSLSSFQPNKLIS